MKGREEFYLKAKTRNSGKSCLIVPYSLHSEYPHPTSLKKRYTSPHVRYQGGHVRTVSWTGPPRGKRAPRVGISSTVFLPLEPSTPRRARPGPGPHRAHAKRRYSCGAPTHSHILQRTNQYTKTKLNMCWHSMVVINGQQADRDRSMGGREENSVRSASIYPNHSGI